MSLVVGIEVWACTNAPWERKYILKYFKFSVGQLTYVMHYQVHYQALQILFHTHINLPFVLSPKAWTWKPCSPGVRPLISPVTFTGADSFWKIKNIKYKRSSQSQAAGRAWMRRISNKDYFHSIAPHTQGRHFFFHNKKGGGEDNQGYRSWCR